MSEYVVVDASVAFKWLVEEEHSDKATALVRRWDDEGARLAAPHLMSFEVANALHRRVARGDFAVDVAAGLMEDLLSFGIAFYRGQDLHRRALELASLLRQGTVYDAHYLALAKNLGCELWTADQRFYQAVSAHIDNVRWLGAAFAVE
ncbi:MAG: type II toxin-antitoxin system VapC family toxin [Chloroflexota bacterium]|nr:type II toxin-antitoxin system VapC family toxin [Chloroflexota bacterium]